MKEMMTKWNQTNYELNDMIEDDEQRNDHKDDWYNDNNNKDACYDGDNGPDDKDGNKDYAYKRMIDDNNDNQQTYDDHNKVRNEKEEMSNDDAHYNN